MTPRRTAPYQAFAAMTIPGMFFLCRVLGTAPPKENPTDSPCSRKAFRSRLRANDTRFRPRSEGYLPKNGACSVPLPGRHVFDTIGKAFFLPRLRSMEPDFVVTPPIAARSQKTGIVPAGVSPFGRLCSFFVCRKRTPRWARHQSCDMLRS